MAAAFTVVIPTHNRRETALLAVRSALAQTRPPGHVIVIADGCTDGTVDAMRELGDDRVDALELPKGPGYGYGHRNLALERARGDVVAWLADDDLYLPDHLERVGQLFDSGAADLVTAAACVVHADGYLYATWADLGLRFHRERLMEGDNRTPSSAVSHTVAAALEVGGWREDLPRAGDTDLWRRMLRAGARAATTSSPTVLHLQAAGREQPYPDRVRQNAELLRCLADPGQLAQLRARMERAVQEKVAATEERAATAEVAAEAARAEAARAQAEAARVEGTLERIYAGGWWRLRARLLPLLRLAARLRPRR